MYGRHALVIGANAYTHFSLSNAVDDARRVAVALDKRGFSVSIVRDPDLAAIEAALTDFALVARTAELAVIYLAGHAVERHGSGYFLPVDFEFPPKAARLRFTAMCLNAFVEATDGASSRIIVLDACRNWPCDPDEARLTSNDLEQLVADERDWPNLLLAYATSATKTTGDGVAGEGSTFSRSFCDHLQDHELTVDECFRRVSQDVVAHRGEQQPWTYSSLARTLSFTDLPRFAAIQRHAVPNPEHLSLITWTARGGNRDIIVGVGDPMAWKVDISGFAQIRHNADDRLMGAADLGRQLYLVGSEGALYIAGAGNQPVLDLDVPHSYGVIASPAADGLILYSSSSASCITLEDGIKEIARHDMGFAVYCCSYMPGGLVWIAGDEGRICEIDPRNPTAAIREIAKVRSHVNALVVAPDGAQVFVVGQNGLAIVLDRSGQEIAELLPGRPYKTAAGIRAQLLHLADDEIIRRFIFDPSKLKQDIKQMLVEEIGNPNYHACAVSPTLPILAVATQESSVLLLDTRDRQVFQELDVGSGNSSVVSGVHFLSDHELAVVEGRGEVTFFSA